MKLGILSCLYSLSSLMIYCQNLTGDNICFYGNARFCCKDYQAVGNMCVKCDIGYRGYNCSQTCPPNHYGRGCYKKCICSSFQYCDAETGCLCNATSANCTDPEPKTVETTSGTTTGANSSESPYFTNKTNKSNLLTVAISLLISVTVLFAIGISVLSIWMKNRLRSAKEERQTQGDYPMLYVEDTSSGAPQPHQTRDYINEDIYAHTTSGIYNHLSLRVQLSNISVFDNQREIPPLCRGLSPDTISERSEERIRTIAQETQTHSQTDSDNSEEVYFDVTYVGQTLDVLHKDETFESTCSLKSDSDIDDGEYFDVSYTGQHSTVLDENDLQKQTNALQSESSVDGDDLEEYINCVNIPQMNVSVDDVYSCIKKVKKTRFQ